MLKLKNLIVSVNNKKILHGINFSFEKGKTYLLMGPNGSGKSTLAQVIMGSPDYTLDGSSSILFEGKEITNLPPYKRAKLGIFLSFQTPPSIEGVNVFQLLRELADKEPLVLREELIFLLNRLGLKNEFLTRSLNEDFSGGEKKKMEAIQAVVLKPKFAIFDEIDTGVDIDSLKKIIQLLNETRKRGSTYLFITHYSRFVRYLSVDRVLVMANGKIIKEGGKLLLDKIEKEGFNKIIVKEKKRR